VKLASFLKLMPNMFGCIAHPLSWWRHPFWSPRHKQHPSDPRASLVLPPCQFWLQWHWLCSSFVGGSSDPLPAWLGLFLFSFNMTASFHCQQMLKHCCACSCSWQHLCTHPPPVRSVTICSALFTSIVNHETNQKTRRCFWR